MNKFKAIASVAILASAYSCCSQEASYQQVYTTPEQSWVEAKPTAESGAASLTLDLNTATAAQTVDGFGACFNELGWESLSLLSQADQDAIFDELYTPGKGANFTICRMPVAANDFSRDWYSYNETPGDFEMKNFSIENDKETLIPFIKKAKEQNPDLQIWGSPWAPPQWMKKTRHYASKWNGNADPRYQNGIKEPIADSEGTDVFIQEPKYLAAYALYFAKYIDAYKEEGIDIFGVMPQNEFNSAQVFPSCTWTAKSLANFIGNYLAPALEEKGVEVMFGTMERADYMLVDTIVNDPAAGKYIKTIGFQWAGKGAIGDIHKRYPNLKLMQTEQECGDGKNDWVHLTHAWDLLKHYFDNGTSSYMYWNTSLLEGGISRWGWAQNSLVVVDPADNSFRYSYEYYLMKHISHFVMPGAQFLAVDSDLETISFKNPDNSIVVLAFEKEGKAQSLTIKNGEESIDVTLAPNSINTFVL